MTDLDLIGLYGRMNKPIHGFDREVEVVIRAVLRNGNLVVKGLWDGSRDEVVARSKVTLEKARR